MKKPLPISLALFSHCHVFMKVFSSILFPILVKCDRCHFMADTISAQIHTVQKKIIEYRFDLEFTFLIRPDTDLLLKICC